MLELYCERARLKDGQTILDVGCGWGSLSLYIAKKYRNCTITGICNSATQKGFIEERCRELQLSNVEIIVADISQSQMEATFDRILSIEMFEHMKNYKELLKKISMWMKEDSLLFVHYFCHKTFAYHFEDISKVLEKFGSNIIFSNGLLDPWSGGSVLQNISESVVALVTPLGAHHIDLRPSTNNDPEWLVEQRESEINLIQSWISDYYYKGKKGASYSMQ